MVAAIIPQVSGSGDTTVVDSSIITITSTAHGLISSDVGKPIGWRGTAAGKPYVWTDTGSTELPIGVLSEVEDVDTIKVAVAGATIALLDTLLPASMPVNGGNNNSRSLYWDTSAGTYKHAVLTDSVLKTPAIYWVGAGTLAGTSNVIVLLPDRAEPLYVTVTTIAELANVAPINITVVKTLGYNSINDGGGRTLHYSSTAGDTVDGVTVFNGPGGSGRFLALDIDAEVTPRQAGCVGDGTTNDYTRLTFLFATGKKINITGGTFAMSGTITMNTAGQELTCSSTGSLKQLTDNNDVISITANKVTIRGLTITGFGTSADPNNYTNNKGIKAVNVWGLRIRDCRIHNMAFAGIYLQNVQRFSVIGNEITGTITNSHDSSSDIVTWGTCKAGVIMGNICASDSDVGIHVGALQGDSDINISNNIVATMVDGTITTPAQRRSCIAVHYSTDADELNHIIVDGNTCVGSRNKGIYFTGWGGGIVITSNTVRNTSTDNAVDPSLGGGIVIHGSARSIIIANNDVSDCQSNVNGGISLYRASAGATANLGSMIVVGNIVHDSSSYGISIRGTTARIRIESNNITNCTRTGIYLAADGSLDNEGLDINSNTIQWATATAHGIYADTQGSTNQAKVMNNTFIYTGTKGDSDENSCIYWRFLNLKAHYNLCKGADCGIYFETYIVNRSIVPDIDENKFEDLDVAVIAKGSDTHDTVFVGNRNTYDNCAAASGGDGAFNPVRIAEVDRVNATVTMRLSTAPSAGNFIQGDSYWHTSPTAGGSFGGTCVTNGEPGTWKTWPNLSA